MLIGFSQLSAIGLVFPARVPRIQGHRKGWDALQLHELMIILSLHGVREVGISKGPAHDRHTLTMHQLQQA